MFTAFVVANVSLLNNEHKILIYVFDEEMHRYYTNNGRCPELCFEKDGEFVSKAIFERCGQGSFTDIAFGSFAVKEAEKFDYKVNVIHSHDYEGGFYLRIFEVTN